MSPPDRSVPDDSSGDDSLRETAPWKLGAALRPPATDLDALPLDELASEYLERCHAGERPTIAEYQKRHPELADEIAALFPTIGMLESLREVPGSSSARRAVTGIPHLDQLGDFRIIREIGRGGMGVVFEAEQISLRRRVALKILGANVAASEQSLNRFLREAEAAASLHHTNIVPVFGTGEEHGVRYYAMQYIEGWPLSEVISSLAPRGAASSLNSQFSISSETVLDLPLADVVRQSRAKVRLVDRSGANSPQRVVVTPDSTTADPADTSVMSRLRDPREAARLMADLADAVAYAHAHGVLHRDLKPANVLVDHQGTGWLVDFGLAKSLDATGLTNVGDTVGTVRYMAPEQFHGGADERSDVYSLGLTLFELLAKVPAYPEWNQAQLIQRKTTSPPAALRQLAPGIPRDLETIVAKACAIDRVHRYQSAEEFGEDLRRFIDDQPIRARRVYLLERFWRWSRHNPAIAGLTTLTAVLLLGVVVTFAVGNAKTRQALGQARDENARAQAENHRAEANLKMAISALDEIMSNLAQRGVPQTLRISVQDAETEVQEVPVTQADAELLNSLLGFYEKFATENRADLKAETARALSRIGDIQARLGQLDESQLALERAIVKYRELYEQTPTDEALLLTLADNINRLGDVQAQRGQVHNTITSHQQAVALLEPVGDQILSDPRQLDLAKSLIQLASVGPRAGAWEMLRTIHPGPPGRGRGRRGGPGQRSPEGEFARDGEFRGGEPGRRGPPEDGQGRGFQDDGPPRERFDGGPPDGSQRNGRRERRPGDRDDFEFRNGRGDRPRGENFDEGFGPGGPPPDGPPNPPPRGGDGRRGGGRGLDGLEGVGRGFEGRGFEERGANNRGFGGPGSGGPGRGGFAVIGENIDSYALMQRASALLGQLMQRQPSNPEYRLAYARCELNMPPGPMTGPPPPRDGSPPALPFAEPLQLFRALVAEFPERARYAYELALALSEIAARPAPIRPEDRLKYYREAEQLADRLTTSHPSMPEYQVLTARVEQGLALQLEQQGMLLEGQTHLRRALEIQQRLAEQHPLVMFYQVSWVQTLVEWSEWQRRANQGPAARVSLEQAVAAAEKSAANWGDDPLYAQLLENLRRRSQQF